MNKFLSFLLSVYVLVGCSISDLDKYSDVKIPIDTSIPLGYTELNDDMFLDQVPDSLLTDDAVVTISQSSDLELLPQGAMDKILVIADQSLDFDVITPMPSTRSSISGYTSFTSVPVVVAPKNVNIALGSGVSLSQAKLSSGVFSVSAVGLSAGISVDDVVVTVPEIVDLSGSPLVVYFNKPLDITGYTLSPAANGDITLNLDGVLAVESSLLPGFIGTDFIFDAKFSMTNIGIESAEGFFGRQELDPIVEILDVDKAALDFFDTIKEFYLSSPSLSTNVKTNIGIPILVVFNSIKVNGEMVELKKNTYGVDRILVTKDKESVFNIDNSSFVDRTLSDLITKDLSSIEISLSTIINPVQAELYNNDIIISKENVFSSTTGKANGLLKFNLPIMGRFKGLTYDQSFDLDLGLEQDQKDAIDELALAVLAENYFPFDITLDLYTEDKVGNATLLLENFINIPSSLNNVDPKIGVAEPGVIDESNYTINSIIGNDIKELFDASKLLFKINANSKGIDQKEIISLYKGSRLKLSITAGIKGESK